MIPSLKALRNLEKYCDIRRSDIVLLGQTSIMAYCDMFNIGKETFPIHTRDVDACIPGEPFRQLLENPAWTKGSFAENQTVQKNFKVPRLKEPVTVDLGNSLLDMSYEELRDASLPYYEFRLIHPQHAIKFYAEANRPGDAEKVAFIANSILPLTDTIAPPNGKRF